MNRSVAIDAWFIKSLSFDPEKFISPEIKSDSLKLYKIPFKVSSLILNLILDLLNLFIFKLSSREKSKFPSKYSSPLDK